MLGSDHIQDRTPLRKSTEVVGHDVFFTYLYAGASDVYMETGEETIPIRLIPYFAWSNRGPSAMSVWLPVQWND